MDAVDVVAFSQRDARWAAERLGEGELSIGQAGCLMTAVASLLASWGGATDPHRLNEFVLRSFGFVDGNLFVFASVDGLGCRFVELVSCEQTPAPVARLAAAIAAGAGVVACVDATPGGMLQQHWVWITSLTERSGRIVDPWQLPGHEEVDLDRYLAAGWDPARGIFAAAIYSRLDGRSALAWRSAVEARQPRVCVLALDHVGAKDAKGAKREDAKGAGRVCRWCGRGYRGLACPCRKAAARAARERRRAEEDLEMLFGRQAVDGSVRDRPEQAVDGSVGDRPEQAVDGSVGDRPEQGASPYAGDFV